MFPNNMPHWSLLIGLLAASLLLSLLLGPFLIERLRILKFGQVVREEGPASHQAKSGTPTMGGLLFLIPPVVVSLMASPANPVLWGLWGSILLAGGVGFADDFLKIRLGHNRGISPKTKMAGLLLAAAALIALLLWQNHGPFVLLPGGAPWPLGLAYWALVVLVVTGTANGVNLTDGLDGLATSTALVTLGALSFMLFLDPNPLAGTALMVAFPLIGSLLAFLWFNGHPAQVFMGDTGSLALGMALAVVAIAGHLELGLLLAGGVFVAETLSVIGQVLYFKRTRKRLFRMSPLHHHFELGGWPETRVVTRFTLMAVICALLTVLARYGALSWS